MTVVGTNKHTYRIIPDWPQLPGGWELDQVPGVAVDEDDNVYAFTRSEHPIIVFDSDGRYLDSWGEGLFAGAHGMRFAPDGTLWLVDHRDHTIKRFTKEGDHLQTLGTPGVAGEQGDPFNLPTDVHVDVDGRIYVSDGYGNSRVHVFSAHGDHIRSWGREGVGEGDFNTPHNVWVHRNRVYVSDRENSRIQIFDPTGVHLDTWTDFILPTAIYIDAEDAMYVAELRNRVTIVDLQGRVLGRWGRFPSREPGQFIAPHGLVVDSTGAIYVSEVMEGRRIQKFVPLHAGDGQSVRSGDGA